MRYLRIYIVVDCPTQMIYIGIYIVRLTGAVYGLKLEALQHVTAGGEGGDNQVAQIHFFAIFLFRGGLLYERACPVLPCLVSAPPWPCPSPAWP